MLVSSQVLPAWFHAALPPSHDHTSSPESPSSLHCLFHMPPIPATLTLFPQQMAQAILFIAERWDLKARIRHHPCQAFV